MELRTTPLLMSRMDAENDSTECLRLIERAMGGDTAAFEQIIIRHERRVLTLAWRLLGKHEDAQDAAQEVFLRAYRYLPRFDLSRRFEPWLVRMTVNVCRDLAKKRMQQSRTIAIDERDRILDPHAELQAAEQKRTLYASLQELPEKERAALVLRDLEGLSTSEVAEILGSSTATVRVQISSARIKIRKFFKKMKRESK